MTDKDAEIARLRAALERIRDRKARAILPWTHEQAADEYARMLGCDRTEAREALAALRAPAEGDYVMVPIDRKLYRDMLAAALAAPTTNRED